MSDIKEAYKAATLTFDIVFDLVCKMLIKGLRDAMSPHYI